MIGLSGGVAIGTVAPQSFTARAAAAAAVVVAAARYRRRRTRSRPNGRLPRGTGCPGPRRSLLSTTPPQTAGGTRRGRCSASVAAAATAATARLFYYSIQRPSGHLQTNNTLLRRGHMNSYTMCIHSASHNENENRIFKPLGVYDYRGDSSKHSFR